MSQGSSTMMTYANYKPHVALLIKHYQTKFPTTTAAANWSNVLTLFIASVESLLSSLNVASTTTDRRAVVIQAAIAFYKASIMPTLSTAINQPLIFNNFIEPAIENALPMIVGGIYDALAQILTQIPPVTPVGPPPVPTPPGTGPVLPPGWLPY